VKHRKDVSLTIRLWQPLEVALERVAGTERRSLSQIVGFALEPFLERHHEWPPTTSKPTRKTARGS
jgi:hypothetical protein